MGDRFGDRCRRENAAGEFDLTHRPIAYLAMRRRRAAARETGAEMRECPIATGREPCRSRVVGKRDESGRHYASPSSGESATDARFGYGRLKRFKPRCDPADLFLCGASRSASEAGQRREALDVIISNNGGEYLNNDLSLNAVVPRIHSR